VNTTIDYRLPRGLIGLILPILAILRLEPIGLMDLIEEFRDDDVFILFSSYVYEYLTYTA